MLHAVLEITDERFNVRFGKTYDMVLPRVTPHEFNTVWSDGCFLDPLVDAAFLLRELDRQYS